MKTSAIRPSYTNIYNISEATSSVRKAWSSSYRKRYNKLVGVFVAPSSWQQEILHNHWRRKLFYNFKHTFIMVRDFLEYFIFSWSGIGKWRANPCGNPVAWDVARRVGRSISSVLRRKKREGNVWGAGTTSCYDGAWASDFKGDILQSGISK